MPEGRAPFFGMQIVEVLDSDQFVGAVAENGLDGGADVGIEALGIDFPRDGPALLGKLDVAVFAFQQLRLPGAELAAALLEQDRKQAEQDGDGGENGRQDGARGHDPFPVAGVDVHAQHGGFRIGQGHERADPGSPAVDVGSAHDGLVGGEGGRQFFRRLVIGLAGGAVVLRVDRFRVRRENHDAVGPAFHEVEESAMKGGVPDPRQPLMEMMVGGGGVVGRGAGQGRDVLGAEGVGDQPRLQEQVGAEEAFGAAGGERRGDGDQREGHPAREQAEDPRGKTGGFHGVPRAFMFPFILPSRWGRAGAGRGDRPRH